MALAKLSENARSRIKNYIRNKCDVDHDDDFLDKVVDLRQRMKAVSNSFSVTADPKKKNTMFMWIRSISTSDPNEIDVMGDMLVQACKGFIEDSPEVHNGQVLTHMWKTIFDLVHSGQVLSKEITEILEEKEERDQNGYMTLRKTSWYLNRMVERGTLSRERGKGGWNYKVSAEQPQV